MRRFRDIVCAEGGPELSAAYVKLSGARLGQALRQGRDCWRAAILSKSAVVDIFVSLHDACGALSMAMQALLL